MTTGPPRLTRLAQPAAMRRPALALTVLAATTAGALLAAWAVALAGLRRTRALSWPALAGLHGLALVGGAVWFWIILLLLDNAMRHGLM